MKYSSLFLALFYTVECFSNSPSAAIVVVVEALLEMQQNGCRSKVAGAFAIVNVVSMIEKFATLSCSGLNSIKCWEGERFRNPQMCLFTREFIQYFLVRAGIVYWGMWQARIWKFCIRVSRHFRITQSTSTACLNRKCVTADGVQRGISSINFQMPGPSLHVCKGDVVVVDVHHEAEGISMSIRFMPMTSEHISTIHARVIWKLMKFMVR